MNKIDNTHFDCRDKAHYRLQLKTNPTQRTRNKHATVANVTNTTINYVQNDAKTIQNTKPELVLLLVRLGR